MEGVQRLSGMGEVRKVEDESCSCILVQFKRLNGAQRQICQQCTSVVQSRDDMVLNKCLSRLCGTKWRNPSDLEDEKVSYERK